MKTAALVFLMLALPAAAQAPKPQASFPPETVYSYSDRIRDNELSQRFLYSLLRPSYNLEGQFAKWKNPVCLRVSGLAFSDAYFLEQRIGDIARKTGASLDPNKACRPNIAIFVTSNPQLALDAMRTKQPLLFAASAPRELKAHYPVQAWYLALDRDHNGHYSPDIPPSVEATDIDTTRVLGKVPMMAADNTRLKTGIQSELESAVILVDSAAIGNLPLASIADYIALMSLAQTPATGHCQPAPSIANLFLADCGPDLHAASLSNADLAMLTSLYETPDEPEKVQLTRLLNNMRRNLEAGGGK